MTDDIYLRYFKYHYQLYGTVNNIGDNDVVEYEGQTLKIGWFKRTIRNKHSHYTKGENKRGCMTPLMLRRYEVLDELGFEWTPQKALTENILTNDKYIKYLREYYQEHGTINDIKYTAIVEYNGETLKIGVFIKTIRAAHKDYEQGIKKGRSFSKVSLARYKALDEMQFSWNTKDNYHNSLLENDPYLKYLKYHYHEHGTINDISNRMIVEFNEETLNIGQFLKNMRNFYNHFNPEKRKYSEETLALYSKRKKVLDELGFIWNPSFKNETAKIEYDPFLEYLKQHYQEHGTINDIPFSLEVNFNGQVLKIGEFLKSMRYNHKFYVAGKKRVGARTKIALHRYQVLDELGFIWIPEKRKEYTGIARKNGLKPSTVSHLVKKFNGDVDKALCLSLTRKQKRAAIAAKKKEKENIDNLVAVFDVNSSFLESYIGKKSSPLQKPKEAIMYDSNTTLAEFCLQNAYNYDVILRAINKRRKLNPEEDINIIIKDCIAEYNSKEQGKVSSFVYGKYNNEILAKHLLISLGLDYHAILRDMTNNSITLEEAIERECFRKTAKKEFAYLDGIFYDFIEFYHLADNMSELKAYQETMVTKYHLSPREIEVVTHAFAKYTKTIRRYQLCDVAFEKDQDAKIQKAIHYQLSASEIEEAIFIPLKFDNKVLLGQESQESQRRNLLKELTLIWSEKDEISQNDFIAHHEITQEELNYITTTHQTLKIMQEKVLKKR